MGNSGRKWVRGLIGALIVMAIIGLTVTAGIVRDEGWDGLWNRKRQWVDTNHPVLNPLMDEAERKVR